MSSIDASSLNQQSTRRMSHARSRLGTALITLMTVLVAPVAAVVATSLPAAAASSLSCTTGYTYELDGSTGDFFQVNESTGATGSAIGNFGHTTINGFGVGPSGATTFAVSQSANGSGAASVYELTLSSGVVTTTAVTTAANQTLLAGAVNPKNGIFYFAGYTGTGSNAVMDIYGVTVAGTYIGLVATLATPGASTGDIAFDGLGDLYVFAGATGGATVYSVTQALPTTTVGTPVVLPGTTLATISGSGNYYGISIDPSGLLYALNAATPSLTPININTGAVGTPVTLTGSGTSNLVDLGSCAFNGTLTAVKNIGARVASGDQFQMKIAAGATTLSTGTTTGSTTGLQTSTEAGPSVGTAGSSYTVSEVAAGTTSLLDYASTYSCIDSASTTSSTTSHNIATGSATFTVGALGTLAVGQNVTIYDNVNNANFVTGSITAVNAGTPSITVNVTSVGGSGSAITTWTLYNNVSVASGTGQSTTFTFPSPDNTISNGITGANVTCTFTNNPALTIVKSLTPTTVTSVGQVITDTFVVTNTGTTAMTSVGVTDTQTTGTGTAPAAPTCLSLSNPSASCSGATTSLAAG